MSNNITVKQVAEEVGLSVSTVIQILGKYGHRYRKETRDRVFEAAQRLGYMPNVSARAMRSGAFGAVGLLMSTDWFRTYVPIGLWEGIQSSLTERELALMVAQLPDAQLANEGVVPQILRQLMVDGLLINYNANFPPQMLELVDKHVLPAIWLNMKREFNGVRPDDFGAGKHVTEQLILAGHKRITYADYGTWEAPTPSHYSVQDRRAGYETAMQQAGLACSYYCSAPPIASLPGRRFYYAKECLSASIRPTAVIAYMDYTALPTLMAALQLGIRVPQELTIVTFKDRICNETGLQIATSLVPVKAMGCTAVEMLMERIAHPVQNIPSKVLPFSLHLGDTWAPPGS